jgi:Leucine-rich repeat (LRR) protein/predicted DNA-binding WGR domain protein
MTQYFELETKFWEITLDTLIVKTRYGKIGVEGKITENQFETPEKAQKEYDKLVAEKTKKGYKEIPKQPGHTMISWQEFEELYAPTFDMPFGDFAADVPVRLIKGENLHYTSDRVLYEEEHPFNVVIDGNVKIDGNLRVSSEGSGNFLLITGDLEVNGIIIDGCSTLEIRGNVQAKKGILTMYGDDGGYLSIGGDVDTKFLLNGFYFNLEVGGDIQGTTIDYQSNGMESPDYTRDNIADVIIPELLETDGDLSIPGIIEFLEQGKQILINDTSTAEESTPAIETIPRLISNKEADERFDLSQYEPFGDMDFVKVILLEGDSFINGDLDQAWAANALKVLGQKPDVVDTLVLVNGSLTVAGTIHPSNKSFPFLLVLGDVKCDVLESYDECIFITGDADIKYAFDGNYNDGSIVIGGTTRVPYLLNSDHSCQITAEGAVLINYYGDDNDFFEYDYTEKDFERVFVSAVFNEKKEFSQVNFIELLKAGKSPLKKGAKPARLILQEELQQMAAGESGEITELDLSDKNLKEFPKFLTRMTSIRKLIFNDNPIGTLPPEIKNMINLEELYLEKCGLLELPEEFAELPKLRILDVSGNFGTPEGEEEHQDFVLPENIGKLQSLEKLTYNYLENLDKLPAGLSELKNLEEIEMYQCCKSAPIDFPEVLTKIPSLKRLLLGSNSFRTIPDSILNLQNLEELNLDASLCYLDKLPDLSKLKNLKILHGDGLISYTSRPSPKQSLLKSFFTIPSLEQLYIDRHGERKEAFIKKDLFAEIKSNLAHDPERFKEFESHLSIVPNEVWGDGRKGIVRPGLTPEYLEGIGQLKNLKVLDLSFNGLTDLPEDLFELTGLQILNLRYNKFSVRQRLDIAKKLPNCSIDFRDNRPDNDEDKSEEVVLWKEMNALMTEANALMNAKQEPKKLQKSLKVYDAALDYFSSGKVVDEYNLLYANYGKTWAYSYLNTFHKATFSKEKLLKSNQDAIQQGLKTLSMIPVMIWHFTDMGKFHKEVTRITANSVAWQMMEIAQNTKELEEALSIIEKAVQYVESGDQYFVYDTQVRILIKLGREEEAYKIVRRVLAEDPAFADFQDLKNK